MVLLCTLVALTAGCGGGGGGGVPASSTGSQGTPGAGDSPGASGDASGGAAPGGQQSGAGDSITLRISGKPPTEVLVDTPFSFRPTVDNPGGRPLSFSVANLPRWARVNASTGEISGTPTAADVGTYSNIQITVTTSGHSRTSLPYTIEVVATAAGSITLNWSPPTQNADGTPLTDLAGYRIHYGPSAYALTRSVSIENPGLTTAVIDNLTRAVWFFAASSYNSKGVESSISNVVSVEIR